MTYYLRHKYGATNHLLDIRRLDDFVNMSEDGVANVKRVRCPVCSEFIDPHEGTVLVPIGTDDDESREKAVNERWASFVALPVHAGCA